MLSHNKLLADFIRRGDLAWTFVGLKLSSNFIKQILQLVHDVVGYVVYFNAIFFNNFQTWYKLYEEYIFFTRNILDVAYVV